MVQGTAPGPVSVRPWLSMYPPGIPAEIDVTSPRTLVDILRLSTTQCAARPAIRCFGTSVTYAELGASADAIAAWLVAEGFGKGDRIAIMMPNVPAYPATIYGILLAGCVVVNVNPLYTPRELAVQINDSGAKALFVLENFAHTVAGAGADLDLDRIVVAGPGDGLGLKGRMIDLAARHIKKAVPPYRLPTGKTLRFDAVVRRGRSLPKVSVPVGPQDLAFLQYTGGTTGAAKAAMLTHANVVANVAQCRVWFCVSETDGVDRVMVTALPLYHIFALTGCFFLFMSIGGCCLLIPNPRDVDGFVKTLKGNRFTHISGVNTLFNMLNNHPKITEVDFSAIHFVIAGGMAVQAPVAAKWKAITGKSIVEGYGLSETSPVVCVNDPRADWTGTIGFPVPSTDVAIRDAEGRDVLPGEPGELCVRGPQVMAGYWKRPDETALATTSDGYFRTGDVAVLQADGQVRIVDRMKDMILVSGFNVYPNEVEEILVGHPGVLECAVVGTRSEETGEMVVAHVVLKDKSVDVEALRSYARSQLTGYKVPRRIVFHDALPKTNVGKVLRRALRDDAARP
ncbi:MULTISPECIES: AMP-binding protein [unclassified Methylobacterium]|uniref:AMP-binding protein n=1 Tax=unclassified Methylobacterium TaxID=2615210 RepID=UPI0006FDB587|nr:MULTISPECIES: AMP-binding protein [unclassified Methylobacterium]KQO60895.1 long-chain fatty acid--CoA ligase [Methylobacterium sp. Leaf86]KQO88012.1 long-chain fatty acid--CoA ligase [Methylobacterium sp. Leaf91]